MAKNIVICCDGTGNEYGGSVTNVLKLFSILPGNSSQQISWYNPGIGTYALPAALTSVARAVTKIMGLAFGLGITKNIADAYRYLMNTYKSGDNVFIFGFSRGAYTARALAAMIRKIGLLEYRNENLIPYAIRMFRYERDPEIYSGFRKTFSRRCNIHFLGLWDTVKSVGWIYDPLTLPFTMQNNIVSSVRHAVSIDERRCFFRQNLWGNPEGNQEVKQVWFAGTHSDVGGSYDERESGLSQIALKWMIEEALGKGLLINVGKYSEVVPNQISVKNSAVLHTPPDYKAEIHESLKGVWWIPEFLPKLFADRSDEHRRKLKIPKGERRYIQNDALLHESVQMRLDEPECDYSPENLPERYEICQS